MDNELFCSVPTAIEDFRTNKNTYSGTATPIQSIFLGILDIEEDCKCVALNVALHLKISSTLLTLAWGATGN